jgi:hypothetical protein
MRIGSWRAASCISISLAAFVLGSAPPLRPQAAPPKKPAPAPVPAPAPAAPAATHEKHMLWKITSGASEAWLLGSLRAVPRDLYPLPAEIEQRFEHSTQLVVDFDPDAQRAEIEKIREEKGRLAAGETVGQHMTRETSDLLFAFCKQHDVKAKDVEPLRPWFIATEVVEPAVLQKLGYDEGLGLDRHFIQQAKQKGKRIHELETFLERVGVLAGMTEPLQEKLLDSMLRDAPRRSERYRAMIAAWKSGDLAEIERLTVGLRQEGEAGKGESKEVWEKLIDFRNSKMAERIEEDLRGPGPLFICVGVEHLVGGKGILKLLEAKGLKVEQVERDLASATPPKPAKPAKPSGHQ